MKTYILIPNATSPKNLGDQAMLEVLIAHIKRRHPQCRITVQGIDYGKQSPIPGVTFAPSIPQWLLFSGGGILQKTYKLFQLCMRLTFPTGAREYDVDAILDPFRSADRIYFVGNGYLRSQRGFGQSVFLIILLLPYIAARKFGHLSYMSPMGFGPFAYRWQNTIVAGVLGMFPRVYLREPISLALARKSGLRAARLSYDHAFGTKKLLHATPKGSEIRLGVAIRSWRGTVSQDFLEMYITGAVSQFSKTHPDVTLIPIIQADAPEHHDDDAAIAWRLYEYANVHGIRSEKPVYLSNVSHACRVYGSLTLLFGMRMHANILAISQGTPVVAIAYEHKTTGIMKMLSLPEYSVRLEELTTDSLYGLLHAAWKNRKKYRSHIRKEVSLIRRQISTDIR